jgi:hypothetical protein
MASHLDQVEPSEQPKRLALFIVFAAGRKATQRGRKLRHWDLSESEQNSAANSWPITSFLYTDIPYFRSLRAHLTMAKKALAKDQIVKLIVGAGQASPSPPVGPALGSKGVKSMDFCKVRSSLHLPSPALMRIWMERMSLMILLNRHAPI